MKDIADQIEADDLIPAFPAHTVREIVSAPPRGGLMPRLTLVGDDPDAPVLNPKRARYALFNEIPKNLETLDRFSQDDMHTIRAKQALQDRGVHALDIDAWLRSTSEDPNEPITLRGDFRFPHRRLPGDQNLARLIASDPGVHGAWLENVATPGDPDDIIAASIARLRPDLPYRFQLAGLADQTGLSIEELHEALTATRPGTAGDDLFVMPFGQDVDIRGVPFTHTGVLRRTPDDRIINGRTVHLVRPDIVD